jgi:hypothetical protein
MFALQGGAMTSEVTSEMASETEPRHRSRGWSRRQTLAAVAVAVAVGAVGGAAIYAATQEPTRAMGGGPHGMVGPMHGPPPPGAGAPAGGPAPAAAPVADTGVLHSESVVSDGNGGFTTKLSQTGTVDEVTLTNVVVRSSDGYTQIYTFPSAASTSNRSVAVNDTVSVEATRTGATLTLDSIGDTPPPTN